MVFLWLFILSAAAEKRIIWAEQRSAVLLNVEDNRSRTLIEAEIDARVLLVRRLTFALQAAGCDARLLALLDDGIDHFYGLLLLLLLFLILIAALSFFIVLSLLLITSCFISRLLIIDAIIAGVWIASGCDILLALFWIDGFLLVSGSRLLFIATCGLLLVSAASLLPLNHGLIISIALVDSFCGTALIQLLCNHHCSWLVCLQVCLRRSTTELGQSSWLSTGLLVRLKIELILAQFDARAALASIDARVRRVVIRAIAKALEMALLRFFFFLFCFCRSD